MEGAPRRPPPSSPPAGGVKSADGSRSGVQLMGKALLGTDATKQPFVINADFGLGMALRLALTLIPNPTPNPNP